MRILHSIASIDPRSGGPAEGVRQLARVNVRYGHDVEVVTLDDPAKVSAWEFPHPVHALGPGRGNFGYTPRLIPWLRRHAEQYDCVIINGIWNYNCLGTYRALAAGPVPYFVYPHGMLDPWFKYRYPFKHLKKWLYWPWGVYPVLRDARAVLFTCDEERRLARDSFWLYDCHEVVVRYGTDGISDFRADYASAFLTRHPTLQDKRLFLFLGRVHPKKGPDILLRAIARLRSEGLWDAASMRLVFAGPASDDYAQRLKSLIKELRLDDSVYWTGMVVGDEKWGAFQSAEAFVLPSHQENFGIAVAEALSAGTPVIISRSVNIWKLICEDGAGVADEDTVAGFARSLRQWLAMTGTEQRTMAQQARPCFQRHFTARAAAASLLSNIFLLRLWQAAGS